MIIKRADFTEVQGDRNFLICHLYGEGKTYEEIAQYLIDQNLWSGKLASVTNLVGKVIRKKLPFLKIDPEVEKIKDIIRIDREIERRGLGKKDKVDLIRAKHEVMHGGKALIDQSEHHTLILQIEKANDTEIKTAREAVGSIPRPGAV